MSTTWNPSDKSASITLSGGNLIATGTAVAGGVRGTTSQATGQKLYFELVVSGVTPGASSRPGFANAGMSLVATLGSNTGGVGWNPNTGGVVCNGAVIGTAVTLAATDTAGFALDFVNNKIWVRKNGGIWNNSGTADPTSNVGGFTMTGLGTGPWFICWLNNSTNLTAFTMSPAPASPPSGFSDWDSSAPPPTGGYSGLLMMGM